MVHRPCFPFVLQWAGRFRAARCRERDRTKESNDMGDKNPNKQPKKKQPASSKPVAPVAAPVYTNSDKKKKG